MINVPITKADESKRMVWGYAAHEIPDNVDEIMDYESSKPYFKEWSESVFKASNGKSKGNIRAMHSSIAVGKLEHMEFDDVNKAVIIGAKIVDDLEWKKVIEGVYNAFSIGGTSVKKWVTDGLKRYTVKPTEISIVDMPCMPTTYFMEIQKMDGTVEKVFPPKKGDKPKEGEDKEQKPSEESTGEKPKQEGMPSEKVESSGDKVIEESEEGGISTETEISPSGEIRSEIEGTPEEVSLFAKLLRENNLTLADAVSALQDFIKNRGQEPQPMMRAQIDSEIKKRFDVIEKMQSVIDSLSKRIETLENMPKKPTISLMAVSKSQDSSVKQQDDDVKPVLNIDGTEDVAATLIKKSMMRRV